MSHERRYPILLAFLERQRQEVVDELVEQFDRCLGDTYARHQLLAAATGDTAWNAFMRLDDLLSGIAASADERIRFEKHEMSSSRLSTA